MNLPTPIAPNGALRVPRSLSWIFMPAVPVTYQRSSNSCALAVPTIDRPPSRAAQRSFLFICISLFKFNWKPRLRDPYRWGDGRLEDAIGAEVRFGSVKIMLTPA